MAKKSEESRKPASLKDKLLSLTWNELRAWSDSRSVDRGRGYLSNVDDPVMFDDGSFVSVVHGGDDYYTRLRLDEDGRLQGECSCPVGYRCKHTVALALVCAKLLQEGKEIEKADMADRKWKKALEEIDCAQDDDFDEEDFDEDFEGDEEDFDEDEDFDDEDDSDDVGQGNRRGGEIREESIEKAKKSRSSKGGDSVRDYLAGLSDGRLRELMDELLNEVPEVRAYLSHKIDVEKASDSELVRRARSAIKNATSGSFYYWDWRHGDGDLPDYSLIEEYFGRLAKAGAWEVLMELGDELKSRVLDQEERSNDEDGEISSQASGCLDIVARAVMASDLDPVEKVKWEKKIHSGDEYCVTENMEVSYLDALETDKAGWSSVADYLLGKDREVYEVGETGRRGNPKEIVTALERAGRAEEAISLFKEELGNASYQTELIDLLLRLGRRSEAEVVCRQNLETETVSGYGQSVFLNRLRKLGEENGDAKTVAVCDLVSFLSYPRVESYQQLQESSGKVKAWKRVREYALRYLETGDDLANEEKWPLPPLPVKMPKPDESRFPDYSALIQISILEKRTGDVLSWYKKVLESKAKGTRNPYGYDYSDSLSWDVADAVSAKFPDEANAIWMSHVKSNLAYTGDSYYRVICSALAKMRPVMKGQGKLSEWQKIVEDIRTQYKRRLNLMKLLRQMESDGDSFISKWKE